MSGGPINFRQDAKQAAIDQWTSDPCGPTSPETPGSRAYLEQVLTGRRAYAPWMSEVLRYGEHRGQQVLDVGCGQGLDVVQYALGGATVTGVDLTPRHVMLARQHAVAMNVRATVVQGDAESLPFPDSSFDYASSNGVLHHTPNTDRALAEIRRVVRPGGSATIILYNKASAHYWLTQVVEIGIIRGRLFQERSMAGVMSTSVERTSVDARPLVKVYTPWRVRRMMLDAGFSRVRVRVRHLDSGIFHLRRIVKGRTFFDRLGRLVGWYVVADGYV